MNRTSLRLGTAVTAVISLVALALLGAPSAQAAALVTPASPSEFIAGTGTAGCPTEGADAATSDISEPWDALPDAVGNTYFTSMGCGKVYRIDSAGKVWTFAGTGSAGSGGDGGLATAATLCRPLGLALYGNGLYISEQGINVNAPCKNYGHTIRRVDLTTGIITTIAGQVGVNSSTGDGGLATAATFISPSGITFDASGNLYVVDYDAYNIRKIDTEGYISTFRQLSSNLGPRQVAFDSSGVMYYAVANAHKVYKYEFGSDTTTEIANGGSNSLPEGVAVDGSGNVYVTERGYGTGYQQSIHVINADGTSTYGSATLVNASTTGCTSGTTAGDMQVSYPWLMHITPDGKSLLVAIGGCSKIARFGPKVGGSTAATVAAASGSSYFGAGGTLGAPTVTEDSGGATVTFGGGDTAPTCGLVDGSSNPVTLNASTPIGSYTTRCSGASKAGYSFSYTDGSWTVSASPYTGEGYFKPVYPGVVNELKAGYTIDLRFRVFNNLVPVTDPSAVTFAATEVPCVVGAPYRRIRGEREYAAPLKYVTRKYGQGYFYGHWQAPLDKGKCFDVSYSAGGVSVVSAVFRVG